MSVCPVARVSAPVERVWALLADPAEYGQWMDGAVDSVEPPGSATPGQKVAISAHAFGKRWRVTVAIDVVDDERHQIGVRVPFPFGVVEHSQITCTPLDARSCWVSFG